MTLPTEKPEEPYIYMTKMVKLFRFSTQNFQNFNSRFSINLGSRQTDLSEQSVGSKTLLLGAKSKLHIFDK